MRFLCFFLSILDYKKKVKPLFILSKGGIPPHEWVSKYKKGMYIAYAIMTIVFTLSLVR